MDHFAGDKVFSGRVLREARTRPVIDIYLKPDTRPKLVFSYPFQPYGIGMILVPLIE